MRTKERLWVVLAVVTAVGPLAMALPFFTDRQLDAGVLNPGDVAIHVQTVRVTGDPSAGTMLYAVSVRNAGTATHHQIVRIELWDGGVSVAAFSNTLGIDAAAGVTAPMAYAVPAAAVRDLQVKVWVGGAGSVGGGETCQLALKFFYTMGSAIGETDWIPDGKPELLAKAGFEQVTDGAVPATGFNPGDSGVVQVATWMDKDANSSPLVVRRIIIQNVDSATGDDVRSLTVRLRHGGGALPDWTITDLAAWNTVGVEYPLGGPLVINDEDTLLCEVSVTIKLTPVESRRIRTRVTLELDENGERFIQSSASPATHVISRGGIEEVRDESRVMDPPVLNPGQSLVQTLVLIDRDTNADPVEVTSVRLRNGDGATALGSDLVEIIVRGPDGLVASSTNTRDFHTVGVEIPLPRFIVPDDGSVTLTVTYRVGGVADERTLRPEVDVWGEESRGSAAWSPKTAYPALVYLYPAGFEVAVPAAITGGEVSSTQRVCMQRFTLRDRDQNPHGVLINPIVVRNLGTADASDLVRIEIKTSAGDLLGETTNLAGIRAGGITLSTTRNNAVADDSEITLEVWATVAGSERNVTGKTVQLETRVLHAEGGIGYVRTLTSNATFTLVQNNPPRVDFTWVPTSPSWKDDIAFTPVVSDPDAGDTITYSRWDFGDRTIVERSDRPEPQTHSYRVGGNFVVVLVVRDRYGLEGRQTRTVAVTPNRPPTVDFTWAPANPTWQDTVVFRAQVTDPDGDRVKDLTWTFGDGSDPVDGGDDPVGTVSHRYPDGGTFTVTLTATDEWGLVGTREKTVVVALRPNAAPVVSRIVWSPTSPGAGTEVTFSAEVTDPDDPPDTPFAYLWSFGDGTTSTLQTPSKTYATAGTYTVTLVVTDARGARSSPKSEEITVAAAPPNRRPTVGPITASPTVPEAGQEVTFTALATDPERDPITAWEWDFNNDGTVDSTNAPPVRYTYAQPGVYTLRVRASDAEGFGEPRTMTLYVRSKGGALIGTKLLDNPARTQARIEIYLPTGATGVKIQIFDMLGRLVVEKAVAGTSVTWDLKDAAGRRVADGLYVYLVTATVAGKTERSEVGKILVLR